TLEASVSGSHNTLTYDEICNEPIHPSIPIHSYPVHWEMPKFNRFNSKEDPQQHLQSFKHG
ncbi:hypothetical protein KI387_024744, partial [Taxus chinensis]